VLEWLKKWWWAVLAGLAAIGGALLGASMRKKPVLVDGKNPEREAAETDAQKKAKEAEVVRDEEKKDAQEKHDKDVNQLVEKQEKNAPALLEDPENLNAYLKKTGDDVRRP